MSFKSVDALGNDKVKIPPGGCSYEVWVQAHFTGEFNSVSNLCLWLSEPLDAGLTVYWDGQQVNYQTPSAAPSTIALSTLSVGQLGDVNWSIGGSLNGVLTGPGYSDFGVLQLVAASTYQQGYISPINFVLTYLEN